MYDPKRHVKTANKNEEWSGIIISIVGVRFDLYLKKRKKYAVCDYFSEYS